MRLLLAAQVALSLNVANRVTASSLTWKHWSAYRRMGNGTPLVDPVLSNLSPPLKPALVRVLFRLEET